MPIRTSKCAHEYGGNVRQPGERFEVEAEHVIFLELLGRIEPEAAKADGVGVSAPAATRRAPRQAAKRAAA